MNSGLQFERESQALHDALMKFIGVARDYIGTCHGLKSDAELFHLADRKRRGEIVSLPNLGGAGGTMTIGQEVAHYRRKFNERRAEISLLGPALRTHLGAVVAAAYKPRAQQVEGFSAVEWQADIIASAQQTHALFLTPDGRYDVPLDANRATIEELLERLCKRAAESLRYWPASEVDAAEATEFVKHAEAVGLLALSKRGDASPRLSQLMRRVREIAGPELLRCRKNGGEWEYCRADLKRIVIVPVAKPDISGRFDDD